MGVVAEMCSTDVNGESWSRLLVSEEKRIPRARLMRAVGDDCQVVLLLVVVVEERGVRTVV